MDERIASDQGAPADPAFAADPSADQRERESALLLRYAGDGDDAAFSELATCIQPWLRAACARQTRDANRIDEAVHVAFIALARHAMRIREPRSVRAWLLRVARHALAAYASGPRPTPLPDAITAAAEHDTCTAQEDARILREELAALPRRERQALVLHHCHSVTTRDAAAHIGVPIGSISRLLDRARHRLRSRLIRRGVAPGAVLALLLLPRGHAAELAVATSGLTAATMAAAGGGVLAAGLGIGLGVWALRDAPVPPPVAATAPVPVTVIVPATLPTPMQTVLAQGHATATPPSPIDPVPPEPTAGTLVAPTAPMPPQPLAPTTPPPVPAHVDLQCEATGARFQLPRAEYERIRRSDGAVVLDAGQVRWVARPIAAIPATAGIAADVP